MSVTRIKQNSKQPRSILFIDHTGKIGGAERSLIDIATYYRKKSRIVLFESGILTAELKKNKISFSIIQTPRSFNYISRQSGFLADILAGLASIKTIIRLAKIARNYDYLYINTTKSLTVSVIAAKLAGKPIVWHARDIINSNHYNSLQQSVIIFFAKKCNYIITNSKTTAAALENHGISPNKISVIYNGINEIEFKPSRKTAARTPISIGIFSHLYTWKGHAVLLKALAQTKNCNLIIVGDVLFGDKKYRQELQALAQKLNITERVTFYGFSNSVADIMQSVDIVVAPHTKSEPFGRTIVEGMMSKKPVIASNLGGPKEILVNGKTGFLIQPNNSHALAKILNELINNPKKRIEIGVAARNAALEKFSLGQMLNKIDGVILQLEK